MNIDERIAALTQSVELVASMHMDNEKRFQQFHADNEKRFEQNEERTGHLEDSLTRLGELTTDIAEGTARLLNAVQAHEHRIHDLEDQREQ